MPHTTRNRLLVLAPLAAVIALPWLLLAAFADRLPERAFVGGWSRMGPEWAQSAPSWSSWAAGYLYLSLIAAAAGVVPRRYWRWPRLQRRLVALAWGVAGLVGTEVGVAVATLLDVPGYPSEPAAWWADEVSVFAGLLAAVLGWVLAAPGPPERTVDDGPPEGVPVRRLGPAERAMFTESMWSARAAASGVAIGLCAPLVLVAGQHRSMAVVLLVLGIAKVLGAKARVQVDRDGVLLDLPLLGVRRRVPYHTVRHAEVDPRSPARGWWPLVENARCWGFVVNRRPVMVLSLSGERPFVAALREARVAAALVNGELTRERAGKC